MPNKQLTLAVEKIKEASLLLTDMYIYVVIYIYTTIYIQLTNNASPYTFLFNYILLTMPPVMPKNSNSPLQWRKSRRPLALSLTTTAGVSVSWRRFSGRSSQVRALRLIFKHVCTSMFESICASTVSLSQAGQKSHVHHCAPCKSIYI